MASPPVNAGAAAIICTGMIAPPLAGLLQEGMRRASVLALALAACGGSHKPTTEPGSGSGSGSGSGPVPVMDQTLVGWGRQVTPGGATNVFVEVSDASGATKSYPAGSVPQPCEVIAASGADAVTGLRCVKDGVGFEFRAVYRGDIIILRRAVDPSDDPADVELSFQEILRIDVPVGSKVGPAAS